MPGSREECCWVGESGLPLLVVVEGLGVGCDGDEEEGDDDSGLDIVIDTRGMRLFDGERGVLRDLLDIRVDCKDGSGFSDSPCEAIKPEFLSDSRAFLINTSIFALFNSDQFKKRSRP